MPLHSLINTISPYNKNRCYTSGCPYCLWQNILDTPENASYTADNKKEIIYQYQFNKGKAC